MKKYIAPILISIGLIAIMVGYVLMIVFLPVPIEIKIVFGIMVFAFVGVTIFVMIERIKELRSGENDDLSKY